MFRITPGLFLLGSGIYLPSSVTFIVRSFCWCRTLRFGTSQNDNARDRGCRDDDRSGGGISPLASFAERPRRCSFRLTRPAMERKRFRVMACPLTTCGGKPLSMVPSRTQGYDAIVVGAGLSGATLAYRLAKRDLRVLVLERGDFLRLPPRRAGDPIVGIHIRSATARPSVSAITYNDLEPYYCEAEELYRVHGSTEQDPTEPP